MNFTEFHLSAILKACGTSLPLVNLRQNEANYANKIGNIIDNFRNESQAIIVGSTAEGLGTAIDRQYKHLSSSDTDIILISSDFKVYEHINEKDIVESSYPTLNHVLRLPDKTCPGYAKLAVSQIRSDLQDCCHHKGRTKFLKNTLKEKSLEFKKHCPNNLTIHGPAVNTELFPRDIASFFRQAGSTTPINVADFERESDYGIEDTDFVFCLKGDKWPSEASEWTKRKRTYNWPTEELFDNIIKSGYFLAGVGSKESEESEIQWRVSFNSAEQLLIESFNETQIHCIMLLKLLKTSQLSKVAGKNITSYTMKTIMFWILEETSDKFWQPSNLLCCVCFCMSKLKSFVEKGFLPNYFIRERNQFISTEFSDDIQTRTRQCLESFLEDPKAGIGVILSTYKMYENTALPVLDAISQEIFIEEWLRIRISMAQQYHATSVHSFWKLYDVYNTKKSLSRCKDAMQRLTTVMYAQPFIKLLQNCMGVLEYIRLKEKKLTVEDTTDTTERSQYLKYMKMSLVGDRTHTSLRIATCYLDDGVKEECLNIIRTVTDHPDNHLLMQNYSQYVKQTLNNTIKAFENISPNYKVHEIAMYNRIINKDLIDQDPYKTIEEFEQLKEEGHVVCGYNAFILVWERCWFDVTFMPAELPVLPKPAALELCIDNSQKKISFHPLLYGLLLEFIWHVNNCSKNEEKEKVLEKMKNCVSRISGAEQSRGINFMIYCCSIQNDHCLASRYLIQSFKLSPVEQNVAYLYIKYIINLLRKAYVHP
ncbi:uncharacterized protein LOC127711905 [Mytilus californianus]|uniref:uncharacterized protein LOC127711905 n=1 Tax=Mytilus californianus TaxID=6549 RepID=UPI0022463F8E|nr:uncharacterized protein LOC127711905 [Mytilus californianus]